MEVYVRGLTLICSSGKAMAYSHLCLGHLIGPLAY